ncbi:MAG: nitroreductase family protein [Chloroflexota bacterium]|nr:nitroreductase family protein [Chloroflexota bacterium]
MADEYRPVADVIASRRSIRKFADEPVDPDIVRGLVALACKAPAPHHSKPWRFVYVASAEARDRLADAMGESWLADLTAEERGVLEVQNLLARSRNQVMDAPALLVSCLVLDESKPWPDERRKAAERDMFLQSLGAALQNLLLAAVERGLAGYLRGAPLFCGPAIREVLGLPPDWQPAFLVLLGYPEPDFEPPPRADVNVGEYFVER